MKSKRTVLLSIAAALALSGCAGHYIEFKAGRSFEPHDPISVTYEESVTRAGTEKKTTTTDYLRADDAVLRMAQ